MGRDGLVKGMPLLSQVEQVCEACLAGKHRRTPFPRQAQRRATDVLQLLHGDICGPITPPTPSGNRYFLLLVDDYSRYMWICLLPTKDAAADAIKRVQAAAERKSGKKVKALRTDRGGEFAAADFIEYCAELGVHRQLTAPYSPQQNGVVERRNQTVVGTARSMMKAKELPGEFWGEAVTTAVPAQQVLIQEHRRQDPIRALDRECARRSTPSNIRLHRPYQDHHAASEETG
jgi:transposase InsO family protein